MNLKPLPFLLFALIQAQFCYSQITITSTDLPTSGDNVRFSTASNTATVNLAQTGANQVWDFSWLQPTGQSIDSFISVTSTSILYFFAFGGNSNVAARGIQLSNIGFLPLTNGFSFYSRNSSGFRQKGFGAELNGIPIPVPYGNDDDIYLFPLNYGDQDTSDSDYAVAIPGQGSASGNQRRINNVDGWGTINTPYGSFNALRIVSTLTGEDSLYIDTLNFGIRVPRPLTKEYKWLANGQDIPVLQINTVTTGAGVENVSLIKYRDSLRVFASVIENTPSADLVKVFPNPVSAKDEIKIDWSGPSASGLTVEFYSIDGRLSYSQKMDSGAGEIKIKLADLHVIPGIYLLKLSDGDHSSTSRVVVTG